MKYETCIPSVDGEDNWKESEAWDIEEAAKMAGMHYDEDDHGLIDSEIYVLVREAGSTDAHLCVASAEPDIHYSATEIEDMPVCKQCKKSLEDLIVAGKYIYHERYCSGECYQEWYQNYRKEYGLDK